MSQDIGTARTDDVWIRAFVMCGWGRERRLYRAMAEVPGRFEWGDSGMPDWARAMGGRATEDLGG